MRQDWEQWSRYVAPDGVVLFHDARLFEGGWTTGEYGPVKLVDDLFRRKRYRDGEFFEEIHSLVVVERAGGSPSGSATNDSIRD